MLDELESYRYSTLDRVPKLITTYGKVNLLFTWCKTTRPRNLFNSCDTKCIFICAKL